LLDICGIQVQKFASQTLLFCFGLYCFDFLVYHAVPREETETVDLDQDGRSRVAISFRMNGFESTSADV